MFHLSRGPLVTGWLKFGLYRHRPARPTCAGQAGQWRVKIILQVKSSNHKVPPSHSAAEVACRRLNLGRVVSLSEASLQGSAKRRGLGCVNSVPGSAWLWLSKQPRLFADLCNCLVFLGYVRHNQFNFSKLVTKMPDITHECVCLTRRRGGDRQRTTVTCPLPIDDSDRPRPG